MRLPATLAAALVTVVMAAGSLQAQSGVEASAARHFERGVQLYQEGSLDAALVEFERAYEQVPSYRLLFNLAQVQAERHEYVLAIRLFERYLEEGAGEITEERRRKVATDIHQLLERVAELWVETNVEGAELFINGESWGMLPLKRRILVNAGISHIRVEKRGFQPAAYVLKVAGGEQPRLNLPLLPEAAGAAVVRQPPPAGEAAPAVRSDFTPFWISAAVTGVLGGAVLTFAWLAERADQRLDEKLARFDPDEGTLRSERSRVRTLAAATDGLLCGTAVAAAIAVYFVADPPSTEGDLASSSVRSVRLVPHATGATLHGAF